MRQPQLTTPWSRGIEWSAWVLLAMLTCAGFLHLGADFPNHSRWMDDAAKFTDEGWYAAGALNHALSGHWLRPGDFNPMVTIPAWSLLLGTIFRFTGVNLDLARGVAFCFTLGTTLLAGALVRRTHPRLALPMMALVLSSPLLYFFSRLAILEAALLFFLTFAAVAAYEAQPGAARSSGWLVACGALLAAAMLIKSSAVFAMPAVAYLVWFPRRREGRHAWGAVLLPAVVFAAIYGAWWVAVVRTHPIDVQVLYGQNTPYLGLKSIEKGVRIVYRSFTWIDRLLFPTACVAVAASLTMLRRLWLDPLFGFAVFSYVGYCGFLLLHFDAGPRYFAILVLPVMLMVLLFAEALKTDRPGAARVVQGIVCVAVLWNVAYIASLLRHPSYSLREAQNSAAKVIEGDPSRTRLVIGHGAMESTFVTGILALDDIGSVPVYEKLRRDHPGWVVTYSNNVALFNAPGVPEHYRFVLAAEYRVLDSPAALQLYRIEPR